MKILILGFGNLARELSGLIKHLPGHGLNNKVYLYHFFVRRNSLSYGRNLVVEIPDPHGNGYRTYKDGLQAVDGYATTVSNYKPWLLAEAERGSFDVVLDCTNKTTESYSLVAEIMSAGKGELTLIPSNLIGVDATINRLRELAGEDESWKPTEFSEEFLDNAESLWEAAQVKMEQFHLTNRKRDIEKRIGELPSGVLPEGRSCFLAIPGFDKDLIERFVVNGEPHSEYFREEVYDQERGCLIIKHGILDKFFGWHHTEQPACREFLNPNLEIDTAIYYKYDSESADPGLISNGKYVIQHVYKGKLDLLEPNGRTTTLVSDTREASCSYMPEINPPVSAKAYAGTELIVFTYKEKTHDD